MENAKILHRQKVRFIIDVEVFVSDVPQALIDGAEAPEFDTWKTKNPEDFKDYLEFQKRILYATLSNQDATAELVMKTAGGAAADELSHDYHSYHADEPGEEEILAPVIDTLSADDKKLLQDAIENEVFAENTEIALFKSFSAEIINSTVETIGD